MPKFRAGCLNENGHLAVAVSSSHRGNADHTNRILSALRNQFGGHEAKRKG